MRANNLESYHWGRVAIFVCGGEDYTVSKPKQMPLNSQGKLQTNPLQIHYDEQLIL